MAKPRSFSSALDVNSTQNPKRKTGSLSGSSGSVVFSKMALVKIASESENFAISRRFNEMVDDTEFNRSLCILFRRWLLWLGRRDFRTKRESMDAFINMVFPTPGVQEVRPVKPRSVPHQELQQARDDEYQARLETLRRDYWTGSEGSFDQWSLKLNLEQWVLELRDLLGKCGPYPDEEAGGCLALFTDKTVRV
ncbi:IQ and AAA domain-containing protein 1-like [Elysia marginata]|uniref:IQ and AAA domain-containing protein 1-like n=1 Tax=Elysia marginata TaxID=1093978 RepID=A0AAV4FZZ4_9GAST|nr:IQ and AAA domain-containing protein 1-like [Elysia marginata]